MDPSSQDDNPGSTPNGATVNETGRPVVFPLPGVTITANDDRLTDPGVRSLTGEGAYWDARCRMDRLRGWIEDRLERAGYDVERLAAMWGRGHGGGLGGPFPRSSSLSALVGTTPTGEAGNPFRPSRAALLARQQLRRNAAALSLESRPVVGWCEKGHERTPENTYHGKSGEQCRLCRNASYRDRRAERRARKEAA